MKAGALILFAAIMARADDVEKEFWPEVNLFWKFHPNARLELMTQDARDRDTDYRDVEVAAYLDFYVRRFQPLLFRRFTEEDDSRMQRMVLRIGYLESWSIGHTPNTVEDRPLVQATVRWAFAQKLLLSSRNRLEFRFINGTYSWRFREQLKLERDFKIRRLAVTVYLSSEAFYDSRYDTVNRWRYTGGSVWQVQKWLGVEPYFTRQVTTTSTARDENAIGLTLQFYVPK